MSHSNVTQKCHTVYYMPPGQSERQSPDKWCCATNSVLGQIISSSCTKLTESNVCVSRLLNLFAITLEYTQLWRTRLGDSSNMPLQVDTVLAVVGLVVISPRQLDLWKVKYSLLVQDVGDLIVTDYNTYHQVSSTGPNTAEAINGCEVVWQPPFSYSACHKRCNNQSEQISSAMCLAVEPPEPARPAESYAKKSVGTNLEAPEYAFGQANAKSRKRVVVSKPAPITINGKLFGAQGKGEPSSWRTAQSRHYLYRTTRDSERVSSSSRHTGLR